MKTIEYAVIDRAALRWPAGPWDGEPDKVQWPDAATGLPCLAVRNGYSGNWCGYVGVAEGHPYFEKNYDDEGIDVSVHGGLTFAAACRPGSTEAGGICHVPEPGEPEHVWWLGFDCAHWQDYCPNDVVMGLERGYPFGRTEGSTYRTLDYVREQCASLAEQLNKVAA